MMIASILLLVSAALAGSQDRHESMVQRLGAAGLDTRTAAVAELETAAASDPVVIAEPRVQAALVALLERENATIAENTRLMMAGGRSALPERYSEYYAQVLGLANRLRRVAVANAPLSDRLKRALVLGTYNPDSEFAKDLASEGDPIVPIVLQLTQAVDGPSKWNGFSLIGELFVRQELGTLAVPMSARSTELLRRAAREGLQDPAADVRRAAVTAVVKAKDRGAIPLLERMAQNDPDADSGRAQISVRSRAAEALRTLR